MVRGAFFSKCKKYRYGLWRQWDNTKKSIAFLLLNPSTADEENDDPTIRRCISFAMAWGYGGLYILNLSPFRATDPKVMNKANVPVSIYENNVKHIEALEPAVDRYICGWGTNASRKLLAKSYPILRDIKKKDKMFVLGLNVGGSPKHPLYLSKDLIAVQFKADLETIYGGTNA